MENNKKLSLIIFVILIAIFLTSSYFQVRIQREQQETHLQEIQSLEEKITILQQNIKTQKQTINNLIELVEMIERQECPECLELIAQLKERQKWFREIELDERYQRHIWNLAQEKDLDYFILVALAYYESRFDVDAININAQGTIDYGLFQVNSNNIEWVNELAEKELDVIGNPYDNIHAGILIFNFYRLYWESEGVTNDLLIQYTLNSYNMGIQGYIESGLNSREYDQVIVETSELLREGDTW